MVKNSVIVLILIASFSFAQNNNFYKFGRTHIAGGFQVGLNNGVGGELTLLVSNFAEDFPFSLKLSGGVGFTDAGDPLLARKVFINNNTNGVPEKTGTIYNVGLDFLFKKSFLGLKRNYLYFGPKFIKFTGNFSYVGGNEDFDVTSSQWGVGAGMENYFKIIPSIDLVFNFGYDYYFSETLYGHDTSYSPNEKNINPREDYTFKDADKAINQPKHQPRALIGVSFHLN